MIDNINFTLPFTTTFRTPLNTANRCADNHVLTTVTYFEKLWRPYNKVQQGPFHPSGSQNEHFDTAGDGIESTKRNGSAKIGC